MSERLCATGCGRPTRDVLLLCETCRWALECDLGDVPWLDEQLELVLRRDAVISEHAGGRSAETPLPLHTGALEARSQLRATLVGWVRDLAETGGDAYPADTMPAMALWLLARINRIVVHPAADDVHAEIVGAVRYAWRVVDLPANRTTFPVGPCPEAGCQGEVRVFIPARPDVSPRMECQACETRWETSQWYRAGRRILERRGVTLPRVDVQVAALTLGVTDRTIRRWVEAGRLANHGDARRILVDMAELERVVAA